METKLRIYLDITHPASAFKYLKETIIAEGHEVSDDQNDSITWKITPETVSYTEPYYIYSQTRPEEKVTKVTWQEIAKYMLALELKWYEEREHASKT